MQTFSLKSSVLWVNIGEVAVQNGILGLSLYQCAHFYARKASRILSTDGQGAFHTNMYDICRIVPQTPVLSA